LLKKDILKGSNISFPAGHSVAFPDINHSNLQNMVSHNRPREIILCAEDLMKLESWYLSSVKYWNAKSDNKYKLSKPNIEEICLKLLKPVHARPSLANDLNHMEAQRIKLTDEQSRLLQFLGGQTRANIIGGAGTGKTVIARQVSENLASAGKKTALICYNRALGDNLKESAGNSSDITAGSFHSFFQHVLGGHFDHYFRRAKENFAREDEWDIVRPFAYSLFLEEHGPQFDAIVVDEGQDFRPDYWLAIEDLIRDPKDGSFYVFSDTNQKIFTNTGDIPQLSPDFLLFSNCRNTQQIHLEAYKNYVGPKISPPLMEGDEIEVYDDKSLISQLEYLQKTLTYLIKERKADPESIQILVANSQDQFSKFEELRNLGAPLKFQASEFPIIGSIGFSTIKKFKGLEAPIVFLWGLSDLPHDEVSEMRYVGITRAKSLLYLVN
jgi:superfamily I DNA/RNA helicase